MKRSHCFRVILTTNLIEIPLKIVMDTRHTWNAFTKQIWLYTAAPAIIKNTVYITIEKRVCEWKSWKWCRLRKRKVRREFIESNITRNLLILKLLCMILLFLWLLYMYTFIIFGCEITILTCWHTQHTCTQRTVVCSHLIYIRLSVTMAKTRSREAEKIENNG